MSSILFYIFILFLSCFALMLCQSKYVVAQKCCSTNYFTGRHFALFLFAVSPMILVYGLRYGVGTDYFSYETIYHTLHNTDVRRYLALHARNASGGYTVEFGYFILNKFLSPSYVFLLFLCIFIMLSFIYWGAIRAIPQINMAFVIFLYFSTQFIYSMNIVRSSIVFTIIFFGYQFILSKHPIQWICVVLFAALFHRTAVMYLPLYFLCEIKNKKINKLRNAAYFIFLVLFLLFVKLLLYAVSKIPLFAIFFQRYEIEDFSISLKIFLHVIPVILPLLLLRCRYLLTDKKASVLFRISLLEIPFRLVGGFNEVIVRLARLPQITLIILIPYVISSIKSKNIKIIVILYYCFWYVFYLVYCILFYGQGNNIPYVSILFH